MKSITKHNLSLKIVFLTLTLRYHLSAKVVLDINSPHLLTLFGTGYTLYSIQSIE